MGFRVKVRLGCVISALCIALRKPRNLAPLSLENPVSVFLLYSPHLKSGPRLGEFSTLTGGRPEAGFTQLRAQPSRGSLLMYPCFLAVPERHGRRGDDARRVPRADRLQVDRQPVVPRARTGERQKMRLGTRSVINLNLFWRPCHSAFSRRLLNVLRQEVVPSTERSEANCSVQSASESTIDGHGDAGHHGGAAAEHEEDNIHDLLLL